MSYGWADEQLLKSRKKASSEEIEKMAILTERIQKDCSELWKLAMRVMPIKSKTYKAICNQGKSSSRAHHIIWATYSEIEGSEKIDNLMPSNSVGTFYS